MKSQAEWVRQLKTDGCVTCHQVGNKATREIPEALGTFPNSVAAWDRRIRSGQAGPNMVQAINQFGPRGLQMYADWSDKIAAGAGTAPPPRPESGEEDDLTPHCASGEPPR